MERLGRDISPPVSCIIRRLPLTDPIVVEICWNVTGGEATLKKVAKKNHGLDFEGEEIREIAEV